jgi:hypothetical protein
VDNEAHFPPSLVKGPCYSPKTTPLKGGSGGKSQNVSRKGERSLSGWVKRENYVFQIRQPFHHLHSTREKKRKELRRELHYKWDIVRQGEYGFSRTARAVWQGKGWALAFFSGFRTILNMAVREHPSPFIYTLRAITATGHALRLFVAFAVPFPVESDRTQMQGYKDQNDALECPCPAFHLQPSVTSLNPWPEAQWIQGL